MENFGGDNQVLVKVFDQGNNYNSVAEISVYDAVVLEDNEIKLVKQKFKKTRIQKLKEAYDYESHARRPGAKKQFPERRYSCPYCPLRLVSRSNLTTHIRTHTGIKPFLCEVCGETKNTKYNLDRHTQSHYHMYDYMCGDCMKPFNCLYSVRKHIMNVHKKNVTEVDHYRVKKKTSNGKEMLFIKAVHNNSNYYKLFHIIDDSNVEEENESHPEEENESHPEEENESHPEEENESHIPSASLTSEECHKNNIININANV